MACDRFADDLTAYALGAPLAEASAAHLAVCERCQQTLAREEELQALIGKAIDTVGSVAPAPDFAVQVRSAVAAMPVRHTVHRFWWAASGVAAAAVLLIGYTSWPAPSRATPLAASPVARVAPEIPTLTPSVTEPSAIVPVSPRAPAASPRRAAARTSVKAERVEVVVPRGQLQLLTRLAESLRTADSEVVSQLFSSTATTAPPHPAPALSLSIPPLEVQGVDIPALVLD